MPGTPSKEDRPESVRDKLEKSRRDVLDLTLRNSLLNFRPTKRRGIEVVDEVSRELFRILVRDDRVMYFLPAKEEVALPAPETGQEFGDVPPELLSLLAQPADDSSEVASRHADNKLQTSLSLAGLNLRLRESFRQARSSIEEQGVNTLYLALGMLRWYESDSSSAERRAPLILVPVQLTRSDVRQSFKLSWTKDEIEVNLSLEAKLKSDFGLRLPEMPGEDDLDVDQYLHRVAQAVSKQTRWCVRNNEVHLNFFSFSKLLIYKDLDPASWPEGGKPGDHPLVGQLYGGDGFGRRPPETDDDENLDDRLATFGLHQVLDADSSQTLAIVDAINGRNLVIQGPPGTGKSQTITNLIAEALARDMKILFVAEKMAALEVVKRRLDTVHLGDACLELHSHNTNKRAVLEELKRTLALGRPEVGGATENQVLLGKGQKRLNDYARAVNSPVGTSELTPHELVGRSDKLESEGLVAGGPGLSMEGSASWSREDFVRRRDLVREMQELVHATGVPREHVFWGSGRLSFVPTDEYPVREVLGEASAELLRLGEGLGALRELLGLETEFRALVPEEAATMIRTARRAAEAPALAGADHRNPGWASAAAELNEVAKSAISYADVRSGYDSVLIPDAWEMDLLATRQVLRAYGDKWWRLASRPFREARQRVRGICRGAPPAAAAEQLELVDAVLQARRLRRSLTESRESVARFFPGITLGERVGAYREFGRAVLWLVRLHGDKAEGVILEEIHDLLDLGGDQSEVEGAAESCQSRMDKLARALEAVADSLQLRPERFQAGTAPAERRYGDLEPWLETARDRIPSLHEVVRFNQLEKRAADAGIPEVAKAAASRGDAGRQLVGLFEQSCYGAWLDMAFRERPVLAEFDGNTHEGVLKRFRELDREQFVHNQALVARSHWEALPRHDGGGQLRVLRREFQKRGRHLPVRRLMSGAGNAIQSIKPVFMMSPLSIAKYIPPGSIDFDIVVFDEASQVRPVEAMGAILRGRQAIVVGDDKQLPPTSFFDRMGGDAEEAHSETADLESILGMFCAQGAPERMLRWHYRSRHESLITVSNHEFYDNRLVVFPSPDAGKLETGLVFRHNPEATYKRRGINADEAKLVAHAVMEHARTSPDLTLGVAAFSIVQARRIEDEVDILRRRDPSHEPFFAAHADEPFFVKNLENVQGDERDVILISIGYGKIDGAYLPMNFGPLNRDGGERRLNVLITRARRRCEVYSNFVAADLDLKRSKARGVRALKTFLKYARTGILDVPEATGREADSPFEEAVAAALRAGGHEVEHQVGSAGFFIDLAVVDPERPGRYMLGIECDGASYHSARSARDRDRLRQQVLEGLGWTIYRIWSTDWFRDRERELAKTEEAIRLASANAAAPPPVKPRLPAKPLERKQAPATAVGHPARPYDVAILDMGPLMVPLHEADPDLLADNIGLVVAAESPVHFDEATLRVRTAAGVRRSGSRIRSQMKRAARRGVDRGLYRMTDEGFLWRPGHEAAEIRRRDGEIPASLRKVEMIAPEEIGTAVLHAVRASYGIDEDEAVKEAIRLFGYKSSGHKIVARFRRVLRHLLQEGKLARDGDLLRAPGDGPS